ncbi:hypothetical protein F383_32352 [Gossypium arboreum]|uniref:Uncharacterized protein n=1 Tax=Gossypium arboreum TaxID=29729 RepID=A0A0B0MVA3_GOSAR|nr:hypothetical protein F383_32352 [Gossypium arboreum]
MHISAIRAAKLPCNPTISELGLNSMSLGFRIHK